MNTNPGPGSELQFALVFAIVFIIIGTYPMMGGNNPRIWALFISAAFLATGIIKPALLQPLNYWWFRFGLLLHKIISPVIIAILYFGAVFPTNIFLRLIKKDPMSRKYESARESYWINREPPGPEKNSFKNQF